MPRLPPSSTLFPYTTLFRSLEVKPLMTLTTVLYLSCALISGHLAMMLMERVSVQQECRDRKSGSAGMPRPISYAVFCLKKKKEKILFDHNHNKTLIDKRYKN